MVCFLLEEEEGVEEGSILMDDQIWSALSQEIIFAVLGHLPLLSFVRFRAVCRQWNAILQNHSSSSFFSSPPTFYNKPWAIFKINEQSTDSHPTLQLSGSSFLETRKSSEFIYPRGAEEGGRMRLRWRHIDIDFLSPVDTLVSSHAGLVLVRRTVTQYLVFNPLIQICRKLPLLPVRSDSAPYSLMAIFGMNPASSFFKVIWGQWYHVHAPGESLPSFLYTSANHQWREIHGRPVIDPLILEKKGTFCNNICYWPTPNLHLLAFDFEQETWHILMTKWVPDSRPPNYYRLWEWNGHLMMITHTSSRIMLWQLSEDNQWKAFDTILSASHNHIAKEFFPFNFTCMGDILLIDNFAKKKLLAYNFVNKDFIISDVAHDSSLFFDSFVSFHPSLEAHWYKPFFTVPHSLLVV